MPSLSSKCSIPIISHTKAPTDHGTYEFDVKETWQYECIDSVDTGTGEVRVRVRVGVGVGVRVHE